MDSIKYIQTHTPLKHPTLPPHKKKQDPRKAATQPLQIDHINIQGCTSTTNTLAKFDASAQRPAAQTDLE